MNKDCASIRKLLPRYLRGYVFKYQQVRVRRHLESCPLCRSELSSLEGIDDTMRILEDVNAPDGPMHGMMGPVRWTCSRLRVLLYRPLWLLVIVGSAVLVYLNLVVPRQRDIEIENIEKTLPPPSAAVSPVAPSDPAPVAAAPVPSAKHQPGAAALPASPAEPLIVTITPHSEKAAGQVNEVLSGYGQFKRKAFSESVHEISGALGEEEFLELFRRIESAGKVSYSRKKFSSFPSAQPIPFVMKLKPAPRQPQRVSSPPAPADAGTDTPSAPVPDPSQAAP